MIFAETNSTTGFRWVLRYSSVAFLALVLLQSAVVLSGVPRFKEILVSFGAEVPQITLVALTSYWVGSVVVSFVSSLSTAFVFIKMHGSERNLKVAYAVSVVALVGAFAWSAFLLVALYKPVFNLGTAV
jgi:hypothetical protein